MAELSVHMDKIKCEKVEQMTELKNKKQEPYASRAVITERLRCQVA